jgi:hypothetical protein
MVLIILKSLEKACDKYYFLEILFIKLILWIIIFFVIINYSINCSINCQLFHPIAKMWIEYNEYVRNKKLLSDKTISFSANMQNVTELPELPINLKELHCYRNNLIVLPALPNKLNFLDCINNKLIELPELPKLKGGLFCSNNNIKYLSQHNCMIIKNISILKILNNPVSDGFNSNDEFKESL